MTPTIAVTLSARSAWRIFPLMWLGVRLAGGRAVRWVEESQIDLAAIDGLLIGGGDDISPDLYGGKLVGRARLDPARDTLERRLVEAARAENLPVLGICRGSQMINVALGGTLEQDAYGRWGSREYSTVLPRKSVAIEPGTRLEALAGPEEMKVNALHSQAVDRLGAGLRVAARDEGGMVQAVERVRDPFMLGVQWHPEHLLYARRQRALFSALVEAARARAEARMQGRAVDAVAQEA
ncbi:gamma-glutamyl-gamma-aminobutyrate hydrolase family protein [Vannielia litorea]|uniref:gamma-glutamyl-gamma-aminobutyrate hydrolase family protein n=1 Tax=Vannielia litorea TaxID=1217970 RepID=UPI001BD152FD|nr:gamma-glutamyl-gamma-aminobutyrate hydrolase family protein [Vannielia litorea]MBS8226572.1 gamma-glutamyl-gamma-aminobutyrate hydrolase family protein [Vannielia litorea]